MTAGFSRRRAVICLSLAGVILAGFIARLADWQIVLGGKYREISLSSTSFTQTSQAVRGEIYDVNGVPLAVNEPSYSLTIDKLSIKSSEETGLILDLILLLEECGEEWTDKLPIELADGRFQFIKGKEKQAEQLKTELLGISKYSGAEVCMHRLAERYSLKLEDKSKLRDAASVKYNMELCGYALSTPYTMAEDLSQESAAVISERTQSISGVKIATVLTRVNRNPSLAPHIVGAVGALNSEEYDELKDKGYSYDDEIGKFGIELACEEYLKGRAGEKTISKNADGTVVSTQEQLAAEPGNTVYLTIDAEIQQAANKALAESVQAARARGKSLASESGGSGYGEDCIAGAAVMLSVKDYSVLAAATYPSFDLSKYYDSDYYSSLAHDSASPLFDRALNGAFAPGSVYKPAVACAALEEGCITEEEEIYCSHIYDYYESNPVACMGYHGFVSVDDAIEQSCNYFFAETGRRLGIDTMYLYAEKFGLGMKTGVEISESTGTLAGRDSTDWQEGNTVSASIGQSDNAFTPIQLATFAATLANGGTRCRTHLVSKITDYSGEETIMYNSPEKPEVMNESGVSSENIKAVRAAMRKVALSGTASSVFADYPISVAAKTGTAENSGSDHTTFIAFAPYENPEVAVAVVIEHGAKSTYSMAVAKAMLDAYFGL